MDDEVAGCRVGLKTIMAAPVPSTGDAYSWDNELRGFGFRVTAKGVRSYVLQYRMRGMPARRVTIGRHGSPWTPMQARAEAERLLVMVRQGINPIDVHRERAHEAVTLAFDSYADNFVKLYLMENWPDSWAEGKRIIDRTIKPAFGKRALSSLTRADVSDLLDGLADRPGMRKIVHSVLRKLFNWAVGRGHVAKSPLTGMDVPRAVPARRRVLSHEEIVCVWLAAGSLGYPWRGVVRLLLTTIQRRDEVSGLAWQELDLAQQIWELPATRAKNDQPHRVPLNALAISELKILQADATENGKAPKKGFLFTTTGGETAVSGYSKAKSRLDRLAEKTMRERAIKRGEDADAIEFLPWRLHDLRRTGATNLQALGLPIEVSEAVLNHQSGAASGLAGVYNRHRYEVEKRRALDAWGNLLHSLISVEDPVNLTGFPIGECVRDVAG